MRILLGVILAGVRVDAASCPDDAGSAAAVGAARDAVIASCDCPSASSPAAFASCARTVLRDAVAGGSLPRDCRGIVMRCVRASTCGAPGAVTCCRPVANGVRCRRRRAAESCAHPGATVCTGPFGACCAECVSGGCPTTSTTTSTTLPRCEDAAPPTCAGTCNSGLACLPGRTIQGGVATTICSCGNGSIPCGPFNSDCDFGACPPGLSCTADFDRFVCGCFP